MCGDCHVANFSLRVEIYQWTERSSIHGAAIVSKHTKKNKLKKGSFNINNLFSLKIILSHYLFTKEIILLVKTEISQI